MTGIAQYNNNFMDSPEEKYMKQKHAAERFKIIQLGIVPWKINPSLSTSNKKVYEARPYNIYVFPNEENGNSQLNCEISAMIFNREHGMDFNKWICNGVNYINSKQYKYLYESIFDKNINSYDPNNKNKYKNILLYKEEDKQRYNEFYTKFLNFYNEPQMKKFKIEAIPKFFIFHFLNNISQDIRDRIYISYEKNENNQQYINIIKVEPNEKKTHIENSNKESIESLEKTKGVKNIFDTITKYKKPIIGHNCSLDILYCISHFGDPLPDNYSDYKKLIQSYFSGVYDTKFLYNVLYEDIFKEKNETYNSSLDIVYSTLKEKFVSMNKQNEIEIEIPQNEGYVNYIANTFIQNQYHQADYDAFVTGCAYVYIKELVGCEDKLQKLNYKVNIMKSFYHCYDLFQNEEFESANSIPYCLKSKSKSIDFQLDKIISPHLYKEIKKVYFIEGHNAMLVFLNIEGGIFRKIEKEFISNGSRFFDIMSLDDFKKKIKEEENKKYNNSRKK